MLGFGFVLIGFVIFIMPLKDMRGYDRFKDNEAEMKIHKNLKRVVGAGLMIKGVFEWMSLIK